jgi:hypothetical protein
MFGINFNKPSIKKDKKGNVAESSVEDIKIAEGVKEMDEKINSIQNLDLKEISKKLEGNPSLKEKIVNNFRKVSRIAESAGLFAADKFDAILEKVSPEVKATVEMLLGAGTSIAGSIALNSGEEGAAMSTEKILILMPVILIGIGASIHGFFKSDIELTNE